MSNFYKNDFNKEDLNSDNSPIKLSKCLELIENSDYKEVILELLEFKSIENEYLAINGLNKIVSSVLNQDKKFKKDDIDLHISNVSYLPTEDLNYNNILLHFKDIENFPVTSLTAETKYNTKKDYFDGCYRLDKFANFCLNERHFQLLKRNIEYLNKASKKNESLRKSFRLIFDKEENKYYVRAITSTNRYYDYNIRFSLFVTIVSLLKLKKINNIEFKLNSCIN